MALLSDDTLHRVIEAAIATALDCDALVGNLSPEVRGALPAASDRPPAAHFLLLLGRLNHWQSSSHDPPPLRAVLRNAEHLTRARHQADVFRSALAELDASSVTMDAPSAVELSDLYTRRAKRFYASCGFEVLPAEAGRSPTFWAWRGVGIVSVIAVAMGAVEEAIALVKRSVEQVRHNEPLAEGCVVLLSDDGAAHEKVWSAGLRPIAYGELKPMGFMEIEALVLRQLASLLADGTSRADDDESAVDVALEWRLRRLVLEDGPRVLVIPLSSTRTERHIVRRLVRACTDDFSLKPDSPAPIVLPLSDEPPAQLKDLVGDAFRRHVVRFSPIALPQLFDEGAFLPIFVHVGPPPTSNAGLSLVRQALVGRTRAVLVVLAAPEIHAAHIARRLQMAPSLVRVVAASDGDVGPPS